MSKKYKYQWLMDKVGLKEPCPFTNCKEAELKGFRWTFEKIEHDDNFLPKMLFDEKRKMATRFNSDEDLLKCSCCALSMFKTLDAATKRYNGMPKRVRQLLGYTNVASGDITKKIGVVTSDSRSEHFDLFEYEKVELNKSFQIIAALN